MRTAGSFLAILGGGVLIVMIYLWSGESTFVLIMSILTLFAAVVLYEWRPWAPDEASPLFARAGLRPGKERNEPAGGNAKGSQWGGSEDESVQGEQTGQHNRFTESRLDHAGRRPGTETDQEPVEHPPLDGQGQTIWRSRFDIMWDEDQLDGLALGDSAPTSWAWSTIDDLGLGLCQAIAGGDIVEERLCLVLQLAPNADSAGRDEAQLMFGAHQDPELVAVQAAAAFRASWVIRSPLHALTAAERTRKLVDALSPTPIALSRETRSPELLYQELRRVSLTNRALRRLSTESQAADFVAAVEALLGTHHLPRLTPAEVADVSGGAGTSEAIDDRLEEALDEMVGQRGKRLVSIGADESDDYLLGLVPAETARHWDGQPVGSGLITVKVLPAPPAL